ncbi:MAG TPA: VOC family protein [Chthoniobacteraceae bacterium]|jgi:predicted enzyme related to lactoylglutathione lyase|nr:VOC family protein [Chthoniobacteraceae bacterium]
MIKVQSVAFTSYPVTDLAKSRAFYEEIIGLKYETGHANEDGMGWAEYEIGGGYFSILTGIPNWKPSDHGPAIALEVEDFDAAIAHLKEKGVPFAMDPFSTPVCRMALIFDPDRNQVIIHKRNS